MTPYHATFVVESVLRKAGVHLNFSKNVQLLACADDIDNIGHTKRNVTQMLSAHEHFRKYLHRIDKTAITLIEILLCTDVGN